MSHKIIQANATHCGPCGCKLSDEGECPNPDCIWGKKDDIPKPPKKKRDIVI